jgi:F0F1-type ATP synthase alpha subunit
MIDKAKKIKKPGFNFTVPYGLKKAMGNTVTGLTATVLTFAPSACKKEKVEPDVKKPNNISIPFARTDITASTFPEFEEKVRQTRADKSIDTVFVVAQGDYADIGEGAMVIYTDRLTSLQNMEGPVFGKGPMNPFGIYQKQHDELEAMKFQMQAFKIYE